MAGKKVAPKVTTKKNVVSKGMQPQMKKGGKC